MGMAHQIGDLAGSIEAAQELVTTAVFAEDQSPATGPTDVIWRIEDIPRGRLEHQGEVATIRPARPVKEDLAGPGVAAVG